MKAETNRTVAIIGCGNLGGCLARLLVSSGICDKSTLTLVEHSESRRSALHAELGIPATSELPATLKASVILICVKPQDFSALAPVLRALLRPDQIVVSMMAGIPIQKLTAELNQHGKIVRTMPNLGSRIGASATVVKFGCNLPKAELQHVKQIIESLGTALSVEDERLIDAATAFSGSGPGFIYYALEKLIEIGTSLGFSPAEAETLTQQTFFGSLKLWIDSQLPLSELRAQVTSKQGTTAAGIAVFEREKLAAILREGIEAARRRAEELGRL
ncbi:MAG: pyrroline-5-carboxylate reductase [Oligoflexia bacterium]|nr:pyrroline-5-carboxylate reductase [Oligoflexia bacterium]